MNLLIDIGNSRLKWVVSDPAKLSLPIESSRVGVTDAPVDLDALIDAVAQLGVPITAVWVSSVGSSELVNAISEKARRHWRCDTSAVDASDTTLGVTNSYADPATMGADRWVALVAARHAVGARSVVVVDAGTAITVDTLNATGQFVGGLILPGAWLARKALLSDTDRIHDSEDPQQILDPFGVSTGECVYRGSLFSAIGGVDRAIRAVTTSLGEKPAILVCGGDADMIAMHLDVECERRPWLVLEGLGLIARESVDH